MAGHLDILREKYFRPALKVLEEEISGARLTEYSLLLYIGVFIALNLANVTFLAPTGWTVYEPYNPSPVNESVTSDNSPIISAAYWDEDGDDGTLRFYDSSGSEINSCGVTNGSRCGIEWIGASPHENFWYAIAEDDEGDTAQGPWWQFVVNNPPDEVTAPDNPQDGSTVYNDQVELKATVSDPDGDEMNVEFLNNVSNASASNRIDYGVPDGEQASVNLDLNRGQTYKWWLNVSDSWNSTKSDSWVFYVNTLPDLGSIQPMDGGLHTGTEVILNGTATDKEQDNIYMYFYNDKGEFLGKDSGFEGEELVSDKWENLILGSTYEWEVNVSDGYENITYGSFSFTTSATDDYRIEQKLEDDYSSIITSTGSSKVVLIKITNKGSTEKQIITYLRGINAVFNENNESSISYTLSGYEEKEMLITLRPDTVDRDAFLEITSENKRIGINTTDRIPVTVRRVPPVAESKEVPGIGTIQIFMLVLSAFYLYSARL